MPSDAPRPVLLVAAGFAISFLLIGGGINTAGVFLNAIGPDTGWSRSVLSLAVSIGAVVAALSMPLVGAAVDRFGVRPPMALGLLLLAGGYAITASMRESWHFVAANLLLGAGFAASGLLPMTVAIAFHVRERTALALGIAASGSSAGAFVMAPGVQLAIERLGWRGAYVALALLVVGVPLLLLAWLPRGPLAGASRLLTPSPNGVGRETGAAAGPGRLAPLVGLMVLPGLATFALALHLVPLLVEEGLAERRAAATLGAALGLSALGKLLGGLAADRFGPLAAIRVALACGTLAIALLAFPPTLAVLGGFAALYGLFVGTEVAAIPALALERLGPERFGRRFGALQLLALLAGAVGPVATGLIFDATGRYTLASTLWGVAIAAALVLALAMRAEVRPAAAGPGGATPRDDATNAPVQPPLRASS